MTTDLPPGGLAVVVDHVGRSYETPAGIVTALDDVSLTIEPGSTLAVTGPSGCGKSTLLGLVGALDTPSSGTVRLGAHDLAAMSDRVRARLRRHSIGFVFQADNLHPALTAVENVELQLALQAVPDGGERSRDLLTALGLGARLDSLPDHLSGGERQRVAIGRALVHEPSMILADEPTGALDMQTSTTVVDVLLEAQRRLGATLLVVTHDEQVAARMDRVLRLRDGREADEGAASRVG